MAKSKTTAEPGKEVVNDDDDFAAAPTNGTPPASPPPPPAPPPKPRFPAPMIREAERLGLSDADIESCETTAELRDMIQVEQNAARLKSEERLGKTKSREPAPPASPPPPPPPEEEWKFDTDLEADGYDAKVVNELKKLGKAVLKAKKTGDKDERDEIIAELQQRIERIESRNHPLVKRGRAAVAKYPNLFGSEFDEDGNPPEDSDERARYGRLMKYLFVPFNDEGSIRATGNPEQDVAAAVKKLFGQDTPGATPAPTPQPAPAAPAKPRTETWATSGQGEPTNRNGTDRTGKPGGEKEAKKKVRAKLRGMGFPVDPDGDDDGDLDDDEI